MDILAGLSAECLSEKIPRQPDQALTLSVSSCEVLATGGDIRLQTDPETLLNGYGCSPRPRPWAITFASSTASSVSERGYMAAEAALLRAEGAAIRGHGSRDGIKTCFADVHENLAGLLRLDSATRVVLCASGTDAELLALAISHLGGDDNAPICNILIGSQETGRGVPLAAQGFHFAVDTAQGDEVRPRTLVAGFRPDTRLCCIALRDSDAAVKPIDIIEAEIRDAVREGLARGERVLLHSLDVSKTGLLAPRPALLDELRGTYGSRLDIVVDACQTRLSPSSIGRYLALNAVVLLTGSKFFTGPPFSGAALLPEEIAGRLSSGLLPSGLNAYFTRDEFFAGCPAAKALRSSGQLGLALRWHAALAEMKAFYKVPTEERRLILERFGETVTAAISGHPLLELMPTPTLFRHNEEEPWERVMTIFTFAVRLKSHQRFLDCENAQAIYRWLNADLSRVLPHERLLASKICHIGQPVTLPYPAGGTAIGALRVSAGARLVSGEMAHAHLTDAKRLEREMEDVQTVFDKIDLILRNWSRIAASDPKPTYGSVRAD